MYQTVHISVKQTSFEKWCSDIFLKYFLFCFLLSHLAI